MTKIQEDKKEQLTWLLYQFRLNESAKTSNIITENMYRYAKEHLQKQIDEINDFFEEYSKGVAEQNGLCYD